MTPPPTSEILRNALLSPSICAVQSMTTASSSVHAGLADHYKSHKDGGRVVVERRTLNPGLDVLDAYNSARIPSNVLDVGKYAKNEGCCQCVRPVSPNEMSKSMQ
jgi:hypothetical protein